MGVKGANNCYKTKVGYRSIIASDLRGKLIAVDNAAVLDYPLRCVAKSNHLRDINPLVDEIDEAFVDRKWLKSVINRITEYYGEGFTPVSAFDGPRSNLKARTARERAAVQKKAEDELAALKSIVDPTQADVDRALKCLAQIDRVPKESRDKCRELLRVMGVPYVVSTGEAERTCALMNHDGVVYATITPDSDYLAGGGLLQLTKKMTIQSGGIGLPGFETAEQGPLLQALGVSFDVYQQICIMAGNDMNENLKHPVTGKGQSFAFALKEMKKHGTIANFAAATGRDVSPLNHEQVYEECFKVVPWKSTVSEYDLSPTGDDARARELARLYGASTEMERFITARDKLAKELTE